MDGTLTYEITAYIENIFLSLDHKLVVETCQGYISGFIQLTNIWKMFYGLIGYVTNYFNNQRYIHSI
jgi:hypothetical protein